MPALREICGRYGVRELLVFGSALGEQFREGSDIDLLVEFRPDVRIGLIRFLKLRDEIADLLGREVDLVPRNGLKPMLRDEVLGSAELLYAA